MIEEIIGIGSGVGGIVFASFLGYNFLEISSNTPLEFYMYPGKIDLWEQHLKDNRFNSFDKFISYYGGYLGRHINNQEIINSHTNYS